ncbi:MAG: efflux RND transporter permease subunit [Nevskia sp.]|nr:efflux RND transporter permease subunit [Nevskia sp.]
MKRNGSLVNRLVEGISNVLIGQRHLLMVLFLALTVFFGYSATRVRLDPGFLKLLPVKHEYMRTMMQYLKDFPGANTLLVNLRWKGPGDIYNKEFMDDLRKATDDVFFIPGINRTHVSSLFTPNTWYIEITEDGFRGEPVVPARFSATPEELERVRHNVTLSGQIGLLVANDLKGALIHADLQDVDPDAPRDQMRVDYWDVQKKLEEIRGRFESPAKYVYKIKHDQAPFKAGDTVAEGFVDYGWQLRFESFQAIPRDANGEALPAVTVKGSDVTVETVKNPEYSPNVEVNIIGFARLLGDVIKGLLGVFTFFALAFVITLCLLFWYTRSPRLTLTALVVALLPVLWLIGILPLIGYGVDPMSILVPFLIFSIGVSHAVQMTNAWRQEVVAGASSIEAARSAFRKLFVPGAVALLTNALGFAVIMFIDIPIVHELGITACLGVLLMIITNKMILPIILTNVKLEQSSHHRTHRAKAGDGARIWTLVARCAEPRYALYTFGVCILALLVTTWASRGLVIGDSGNGAPELRPDSRYNFDSAQIARGYNFGVDVLTVIVEAKDFEGDSCLHYPVVHQIERFELFMKGVAGVQSVVSVGGIAKLVISAFNEGNPRWEALPRSESGISVGSKAFDPNLGFNNESCRAIQVMIFTKNHDGPTIAHVVSEVKRYIAANPVQGVNLRLASGNVGVMAATNEAVAAAEVKMLLSIFGALILLCLVTFRSLTAVICVIVPLTMVSIFCNALMASLNIGLKVATLPVVALGVGVGVDYGIYLFERIQHHMDEDGMDFRDAFHAAMRQRGTAAVFTAITMAVAVGTWTLSVLKFQADMGLLLSFMFLVNMLGAICLLPALGAWFYQGQGQGRALPAAPGRALS